MIDLGNIKVGVLAGGVSPERRISLSSARQVMEILERCQVPAVYIDIVTSQTQQVKDTILSHNIDLAFIALHGVFGEDGQIQQILQDLDIPYTGSAPAASYLAMDKVSSKQIFLKQGIPVAAYYLWEDLPGDIKYPLMLKPVRGGSSLGVLIIRNDRQLTQAKKETLSCGMEVFLEEYIEGRELTVGILDDKPLGVVEIIPRAEYFDFNSKYIDGAAQLKTDLGLPRQVYKQIQDTAAAAYFALGCRHFCRVDFILNRHNTAVVLEVNSIPGLTSHSLLPLSAKCCGIEFDELILKMARLGLNEKIQAGKI